MVGLACFKALSADGISFAIPIDVAKDVMTQLKVRSFEVQDGTQQSQYSLAAASDAPQSSSYWAQVQCCYSLLFCQGHSRHVAEPLVGNLISSPC